MMSAAAPIMLYVVFFGGTLIVSRFWWVAAWLVLSIYPLIRLHAGAVDQTGNLLFTVSIFGLGLGFLAQMYRLGLPRRDNGHLEWWPLGLIIVGPALIPSEML